MSVSGVIWVPSQNNIGERPVEYAAELELYAQSLPQTYGQKNIPFLYAQPATTLIEGITTPNIPGAKRITIDQWPKSLKDIAAGLAELAR